MSFLGFILFRIERESGKQNLGVKEKCPQSYLSYSTGLHWRIFLLSWANRLCSVFSTGLKDFGVPRVSVNLLFLARSKMAMVRLPRALLKNYFFYYLLPLRGREPPLPFWGPRQSFGFSLFPLPMSGDLRSLSVNIWSILRDPHSLLTVTFWLLESTNNNTGG